jgi:hypothetical protein
MSRLIPQPVRPKRNRGYEQTDRDLLDRKSRTQD